ncbi:MAG: hypothetical protein K5768_08805 [Firmicutes bacterium]|nr:hypothetical protein [Bacillota bacterium]
MANMNFTYKYPYVGYTNSKYSFGYEDDRTYINGNYTYAILFKNALSKCSQIKFTFALTAGSSSAVYGASWDFYVYSNSWSKVASFTMPQEGQYTYEGSVPNLNVKKLLVVPSSRYSSGTTWGTSYSIEGFTVTESLEEHILKNEDYHFGVFPNCYGIEMVPRKVFANVNGTLTEVTKIYANIGNNLFEIPHAYSAHLETTSDSTTLYSFTSPETGRYTIKVDRFVGDHEIRLYAADYTPMTDSYFYNRTFEFTANTKYYITLSHYPSTSNNDSKSDLLVYKEV